MLFDYQQDVYKQLCETLRSANCCCVIMGTGVGKTYVMNHFLEENNLKALVVTPRHTINDSWISVCGEKVEVITYSKLARIYKNISYDYDVIVFDEVHHIGAQKWGKPAKYLIDEVENLKVIGLTESPIRYTDAARNVAEEFFHNNIALGYDVPAAIEAGILNSVTYVGAFYNSDGLKKTLRGKIQSRLYAKLNLALNNTPTVKEIILKNMPEGKRKGIIFASTIDDIKFSMDFLKTVYPKAIIKSVHSKQSESINDKNMEWFKNTDEGYLCSVDMISEGVHINGVNTLIMLRRTESPTLFNQQLGRCLSSSSTENAVLFDLVNNKCSVRIVRNKLSIRVNNGFKDIQKFSPLSSSQLIIRDYTKDIIEVLEEIQKSLSRDWTEEEDNLLIDFYSKNEGGVGLISFVKENFKDRTYGACKARARVLGLSEPNVVPYTEEDDEIIRKYYPEGGAKVCLQYLANRDSNSIVQRASKLNVSYVCWTPEEIEIIKKYYPLEGNTIVNRLPNKTIYSIKAKARSMKIYSNNMSKKFTDEEAKIIQKYFAENGAEYVQKLLPNHSLEQIRSKAVHMGIKKAGRKKAVLCIETGVVYYPLTTVAQALNLKSKGSVNDIIKCCKGTRKTAYGFHWKYVEPKKD